TRLVQAGQRPLLASHRFPVSHLWCSRDPQTNGVIFKDTRTAAAPPWLLEGNTPFDEPGVLISRRELDELRRLAAHATTQDQMEPEEIPGKLEGRVNAGRMPLTK